MHERQEQYEYKNAVLVLPHLLYDKFYKNEIKISIKLIIFRHTQISTFFYREYQATISI